MYKASILQVLINISVILLPLIRLLVLRFVKHCGNSWRGGKKMNKRLFLPLANLLNTLKIFLINYWWKFPIPSFLNHFLLNWIIELRNNLAPSESQTTEKNAVNIYEPFSCTSTSSRKSTQWCKLNFRIAFFPSIRLQSF